MTSARLVVDHAYAGEYTIPFKAEAVQNVLDRLDLVINIFRTRMVVCSVSAYFGNDFLVAYCLHGVGNREYV